MPVLGAVRLAVGRVSGAVCGISQTRFRSCLRDQLLVNWVICVLPGFGVLGRAGGHVSAMGHDFGCDRPHTGCQQQHQQPQQQQHQQRRQQPQQPQHQQQQQRQLCSVRDAVLRAFPCGADGSSAQGHAVPSVIRSACRWGWAQPVASGSMDGDTSSHSLCRICAVCCAVCICYVGACAR